MISNTLADTVMLLSLVATVGAYLFVSRRENSYVNIMTPALVINIPAYYVLPSLYNRLFGAGASAYAYFYVYATLATESVVFAYFYTRPRTRPIRLPFVYSYRNFWFFSVAFIILAGLLFVPVLLEFREYIFDPRRIYEQTRTGFGGSFYLSSTAAYLATILALFSDRSRIKKAVIVLASALVLFLHGSKGQVLDLIMLVVLFEIYLHHRKLKVLPALMAGLGIAMAIIGLFAATMVLGGPMEALETISQYSDYTRNAMLVIDSDLPRQYGRLTWESNVLALVPRAIMPDKPKDFGAFYLDAEFYPSSLEQDQGAPAFGIGVQYADFGNLAIVYLGLFAALTGWLARVFVNRLRRTRHPADFVLVAFFAGISLFPIGSGWPLAETLLVVLCLRFASRIGSDEVYREDIRFRRRILPTPGLEGI
jgi:oligosaccharide repeat unit polymerase